MGFSFRKSIKIGKNTRINLSRYGGIGISTGVKGARVSMNQQGIRTTIGGHGLQYIKSHRWNKIKKIDKINSNPEKVIKVANKVNYEGQYNKHIKLMFSGIACLFIGFKFPPLFLIAVMLLFSSLICMIKNWRLINREYKNRKNI